MKYPIKALFALSIAVVIVMVSTVTFAENDSCPVVTSFMKYGAQNDVSEVMALQTFLRDSEGASVDVTGVFDEGTVSAVETFQRKYMSEIMAPWDATRPSGIVYLTTIKKINQLACNIPLSLNENELSIINNYRSNIAIGNNDVVESQPAEGESYVVDGTKLEFSPVTVGDDDRSSTDDESDLQVAAVGARVGGGTLIQRFFSFIAGWFK